MIGRNTMAYYRDYKLHSVQDDMPALILSEDDLDDMWTGLSEDEVSMLQTSLPFLQFPNSLSFLDDDSTCLKYNGGSVLIWFQNGKIHRDGDKPAVLFADGTAFVVPERHEAPRRR